ncbi:MAG: O-antigen ligase family protein [Gaiellales bacterium]
MLPSRAAASSALRPVETLAVAVAALVLAVGLGALTAGEPLAGLAVAGAFVLAVATLIRPEVATLLAVFLLWANVPAVAVNEQGIPRSIGIAIPLIMVVPLLYYIVQGQRFVRTPVLWLLVALLIVQVLSSVFAREQQLAFEGVQTFVFEGLVIFVLASNVVRTPMTARRVIWALMLAGGLLGALSLFQTVTGTFDRPYGGFAQVGAEFFRGLTDEPRLTGPLGDSNYYAQILATLVPLGLLRVFGEPGVRLRLLAAALTGLMIVGIAFTLSRGAGLTLVAVLVLMVALRYVKATQAVAVVAAGLILLVAVPQYRDRVLTLGTVTNVTLPAGEQEVADVSLRGRLVESRAAGLAFTDNLLIGVGPRNFPVQFQRYAAQVGGSVHQRVRFGANAGGVPEREAHSLFLGVAADLGLAGLVTFTGALAVTLGMLARARRRALRARRPDLANLAAGFLLAVAAYVISGVFLTLAFERYLWLLLGLATATAVLVSRLSTGGAAAGTEAPPGALARPLSNST